MKKNYVLLWILCLFISACSVESKNTSIQGKVSVPTSLANKIGPSDVLYILAYPVQTNAVPTPAHPNPESQGTKLEIPRAVRKIVPAIFPVKYEISQEDVIFPEKKFEGLFNIVARLNKNPESAPVKKGDFEGTSKKNPVLPGSTNVDIVLEMPAP